MASLIDKITTANDNWRDSKVQDGGTILVVNGEKDMVTKSVNIVEDEYEKNPHSDRGIW